MRLYVLAVFLAVATASAVATLVAEKNETAEYEVSALPRSVPAAVQIETFRGIMCRIGDGACAKRCMLLGKAGGKCNSKGTCICSSESIWKKRKPPKKPGKRRRPSKPKPKRKPPSRPKKPKPRRPGKPGRRG